MHFNSHASPSSWSRSSNALMQLLLMEDSDALTSCECFVSHVCRANMYPQFGDTLRSNGSELSLRWDSV